MENPWGKEENHYNEFREGKPLKKPERTIVMSYDAGFYGEIEVRRQAINDAFNEKMEYVITHPDAYEIVNETEDTVVIYFSDYYNIEEFSSLYFTISSGSLYIYDYCFINRFTSYKSRDSSTCWYQ